MSNTVLFIDGENFLHKIEEVLKMQRIKKQKVDMAKVDFTKLFTQTLENLQVSRKIFYAAKLHVHPETKEKSENLVKFQRKLRNSLLSQRFEFIMAGNVRGQKVGNKIIFREKGVDVKIAVDLVSFAADKLITTAIICSSDSDLQPAVQELKKRNVEVIYLGFEINPNKGLAVTTNRMILFRNSEILAACGVK